MEIQTHLFTLTKSRPYAYDRLAVNLAPESVDILKNINHKRQKLTTILSMQKLEIFHYTELIQNINDYLPDIYSLMKVNIHKLFDGKLKEWSWASGMSLDFSKSIIQPKKKRYSNVLDIEFEHIMILWTLVYAMMNEASIEIRTMTERHLENKALKISQKLCQVAGICQHIQDLLEGGSNRFGNVEVLPELSLVLAKAMYHYSIAMAQIVSLYVIGLDTSDLAIAKCCIAIYREMDAAHNLLESLDTEMDRELKKFHHVLDPNFRILIAQYRVFFRGVALHHLAVNSYSKDKIGESCRLIGVANKQFNEMKVFADIKDNNFMDYVREIVQQTESVEDKYMKENIVIFRQTQPLLRDIEIPDGEKIVSSIPFERKLESFHHLY